MRGQSLHPANENKQAQKYGVSTSPLQGSIQDIIPIQWLTAYYCEPTFYVLGKHVHPLSKKGNHALASSHFLIIFSFDASSILSCIPQCFIQTALCTGLFSPLLGNLLPYTVIPAKFTSLSIHGKNGQNNASEKGKTKKEWKSEKRTSISITFCKIISWNSTQMQ